MDKTPAQLVIDGFEASNLSYGDIINHTDILAWSEIELPDMADLSREEQVQAFNKYSLARVAVVEGLREFLLCERMMYMQSVVGTGYQIVQPAQQTEAAVRKGMAQIQKGLKHASKGVGQVNVALLDTRQREYNSSVKARLSGLARMVGKKKDYLQLD